MDQPAKAGTHLAGDLLRVINGPLPEGRRCLSLDGIPALLNFPPDMARVPTEINRLSNQILVHEFEAEWGKVH